MPRKAHSKKTPHQGLVVEVRTVCRRNPTLSIRSACIQVAALHGVRADCLQVAVSRARNKHDIELKRSGHHKLTLVQEMAIVAVILACARHAVPLSMAKAATVVRHTVPSMSFDAALMWVGRMLKRRSSQLKRRNGKLLAKKRINEGTMGAVRNFVEAVQDGPRYPKHAEVNVDEMIIYIKQDVGQVIVESSRDKANAVGRSYKALGTYVPFVAADGTVLATFYVHKYKEVGGEIVLDMPEEVDEPELRTTWKRFHVASKTGYVTKEAWASIMDKFVEVWKERYPGLDCRVWMDNLASHTDEHVVVKAHLQGVHCWFLPKNTTHFTQPLDNLVFAKFKNWIEKKVAERRVASALVGPTTDHHILADVWAAEKKALTTAVITKSFRQTALVPFNAARVLERARDNLRQQNEIQVPALVAADEYEGAVTAAATHALQGLLNASQHAPTTPTRRATVVPAQVYTSHEIVALQRQRIQDNDERAQAAQNERDERAAADEQRRQEREAERQVREQAREAERVAKEARKRQREEDSAEKKRQKKRQKTANTCRCCGTFWRSNCREWAGCAKCDLFWVCYKCFNVGQAPGVKTVRDHERRCRGES